MKAVFATILLLGFSATRAAAAWLEVSAHNRVNPAMVVAVEIRTDANIKEATIRTQSAEHIVRTGSVIQAIESLVADTAAWFPARGETVGSKSIKRYVRKNGILFVKYSCPSMNSCTAFVDGYDNAFSRVVIDHSGAIAELKQETGKDTEFTLIESPGVGFEGLVRRSAIRSVNFICSNANMCTQADVLVRAGRGSREMPLASARCAISRCETPRPERTSSVTGKNRRLGHSAHLIRGFSHRRASADSVNRHREGYGSQFSTLRAGTRLNSATLAVTHTASIARA
jgi:hypothetical protein